MGKSCVAPNCPNGDSDEKRSNEQKPHFHRFPKDLSRRKLWIAATPVKDLKVDDESVLCHLHFHLPRTSRRRSINESQEVQRLNEWYLKAMLCPVYGQIVQHI